MTDLDAGLQDLLDASDGYQDGADYYNGTADRLFLSPRMTRQLAKSNTDKLRTNLARIAVDVVADRMEIASITSPDEKAQSVLDEIAEFNEFDVQIPSTVRKFLYFGDMYWILDGDSEQGVMFHENSPLTTRVFYDPENPRLKSYAIKRWMVANPDGDGSLIRVNLYYTDRIERYVTIKPDMKGVNASEFVGFTSGDGDDDPVIPNPYGFIPVFHFRTQRPYGDPEHRQGYGCQDKINKASVLHHAAIEFQGFPLRYLTMPEGTDGSDMEAFDLARFHNEAQPNATGDGPDEYKINPTVRAKPRFENDPASVWLTPPGSTPGQFQPADASNFINTIELEVRLLAQTTGTPAHYFDPSGDAPSGESLRTAEAPLIKKVKNRSLLFGGALQDALQAALSLYGIDALVTVHWATPESTDSLDAVQIAQAKIDLGLPAFQVFQEAGYLPDQLEEWGITQDAGLTLKDRVLMLQEIGKAVQGLSFGVTAGIISTGQVGQILDALINEDVLGTDQGQAA